MINGIFYELIVKKKNHPAMIGVKYLVIILAAAAILASPFLGVAGFVAGAGLGVLCYFYILPRTSVEYEYSFLNSSMDIDVIYRKSRRKRLMTVDMKDVEIAGPVTASGLRNRSIRKDMDCSSCDKTHPPVAMIMTASGESRRILIQPDEKLLKLIKDCLQRRYCSE